jgi:hypothetical protein
MGIAEDLLALADRLADPQPADPEQASLRRSISTAYYALFHLLLQEAVQCWNGTSGAQAGLERHFNHKNMKAVSREVVENRWRGWSTPSPTPPPGLQAVAKTFVQLQDARHSADHDNGRVWTRLEVREKIGEVRSAFGNWDTIKTHPAANEYLLSLLIGNKRD